MIAFIKAIAFGAALFGAVMTMLNPLGFGLMKRSGLLQKAELRLPFEVLVGIGFAICVYYGVLQLLEVVPWNYGGYDEEGTYRAAKDNIALSLALGGAIGFPLLLNRAVDDAMKVYELTHLCQVLSRLPSHSVDELDALQRALRARSASMPQKYSHLTFAHSVLRDHEEGGGADLLEFVLDAKLGVLADDSSGDDEDIRVCHIE